MRDPGNEVGGTDRDRICWTDWHFYVSWYLQTIPHSFHSSIFYEKIITESSRKPEKIASWTITDISLMDKEQLWDWFITLVPIEEQVLNKNHGDWFSFKQPFRASPLGCACHLGLENQGKSGERYPGLRGFSWFFLFAKRRMLVATHVYSFAALSCGEKSRQEKNEGKALGPG